MSDRLIHFAPVATNVVSNGGTGGKTRWLPTPSQWKSATKFWHSKFKLEIARGGRVESQSDAMAVIVHGRRVNHLLHFIIGILTLGFWWFVWIALALLGGEKRWMITVDERGNMSRQRA